MSERKHDLADLQVALNEWKDAGAHVSTVVAALERLYAPRATDQPPVAQVVYQNCSAHAGIGYTIMASVGPAAAYRKVCPICEPPPGLHVQTTEGQK